MHRLIRSLFALSCLPLTVATTINTCKSNSDCDTDLKCYDVVFGRRTISKCTMDTEDLPVCAGSNFGYCPFVDDEMPTLVCAFVETTQLREKTCCGSSTRRLVSDSNDTSTPSSSSSDCYECFPDPEHTNVTHYGTYECIQYSQCKDKAAFPSACDQIAEQCETAKDEVCTDRGTCTLTDRNDPVASYKCTCRPGFSAVSCENVTSNECILDCGVGGTCEDRECDCKKGYTGDQCLGCTSNATCHSKQKYGYCDTRSNKCVCEEGFYPPFCTNPDQIESDFCESVFCGNAGQCVNGECFCLNECAGTDCKRCEDESCDSCSMAHPIVVHSLWFALTALFGYWIL